MKYCVEISNLTISYANQCALENLSIQIPAGKMVGIIGPNGSGKTSLLKGILELIPVKSGKVRFFDLKLSIARTQIAYVPQRESVDWNFPVTVREIVEMGRFEPKKWWRRYNTNDQEIVSKSLEMVGLIDVQNKQISELSGGQQQRVFLARALAQQANLIVLDEPFVGIDARSQMEILTVLTHLKETGKSIIMVHHDLSTVFHSFDWVVLLKNKLIGAGEVKEVMRKNLLTEAYGAEIFFNAES